MREEKKETRIKLISGAILSAFVPVFGYYSAYRYEKGFCEQFNIPTSFIEIGLSEVFRTIGVLVSIIVFIYLGVEFLYLARTSPNPIIRGLRFIFFYTFLFIPLLSFGGFSMTVLIAFSILLVIEVFIEFITPLFSGGFKGYRERLILLQKFDEETAKKNIFLFDKIMDATIKQIGVFTFLIIFLLIYSLFIVGPIGKSRAEKQKSFMIIKSNPELVILRKYSQNFVCVPFDRKSKKIKKDFYLKSFDQIAREGLQIVVEDIGPLKVSKKINNEVKEEKTETPGTQSP